MQTAIEVSIYNFFESKDNLRRIIIKGILDESNERIKALIQKEGNFADKIWEYIQSHTWYYDKYSLQFLFEAIESDPELKLYFEDFTTTNKRLAMEFIDEGKRSGVFSPKISNTAIESISIFFKQVCVTTKSSAT